MATPQDPGITELDVIAGNLLNQGWVIELTYDANWWCCELESAHAVTGGSGKTAVAAVKDARSKIGANEC